MLYVPLICAFNISSAKVLYEHYIIYYLVCGPTLGI